MCFMNKIIAVFDKSSKKTPKDRQLTKKCTLSMLSVLLIEFSYQNRRLTYELTFNPLIFGVLLNP